MWKVGNRESCAHESPFIIFNVSECVTGRNISILSGDYKVVASIYVHVPHHKKEEVVPNLVVLLAFQTSPLLNAAILYQAIVVASLNPILHSPPLA